jgi:hypothetical protein
MDQTNTSQKMSSSKMLSSLNMAATYMQMWILSFLFVAVVAALLQLQNVQVHEQSQLIEPDSAPHSLAQPNISRNNTPALGY